MAIAADHGQTVVASAYLARTDEETWILASQPLVKSGYWHRAQTLLSSLRRQVCSTSELICSILG